MSKYNNIKTDFLLFKEIQVPFSLFCGLIQSYVFLEILDVNIKIIKCTIYNLKHERVVGKEILVDTVRG
jgi:hypothetical protein